jgi:hypothetical protein
MNAQVQAVKGSFEYQGRTYTTFWNGKDYGDTKYITVTSDANGESKVTASPSKGISVNKSHSVEFAKAAYQSITGEEW